jgi:hypothetical protein
MTAVKIIFKHIGIGVAVIVLFPALMLGIAEWTAFLAGQPLSADVRGGIVGTALFFAAVFALIWVIVHLAEAFD